MASMQPAQPTPLNSPDKPSRWKDFPYWLVIILIFLGVMGYLILTGDEFRQAFLFIWGSPGTMADFERNGLTGLIGRGITMTFYITLIGFVAASLIGLLVGVGRISNNVILRNLATTYVEFIRGLPTVVLLFTLAYVIVPAMLGVLGLENRVSLTTRAIAALSIIYGAFLAEVFRAGIESVALGQTEAALSLGFTPWQTMRYIVLPQAIRNVLPALGNDFIALLKDSSLVTLLAVRDMTQQAKLYSGSSFRFRETYLVLTFLYLSLTLILSLLLRLVARRLGTDGE